jgi:glyoxylase-like metal-dependent hydrolase (beta-lactamase superfamily II)
MRKLDDNLYSIEVPLPGNPLKALNAYVILGRNGERSLLCDLGFNLDICTAVLQRELKNLGITPGTLDLFLTHFHSDHVGALPRIYDPTMNVYCGRPPWDFPHLWQQFTSMQKGDDLMARYGLNITRSAIVAESGFQRPEFAIDWFRLRDICNYHILREGDILEYGGYRLRVIETDGHIEGHVCLYEPERKFLIAGDHILRSISPNITCFNMEATSSLRAFLRNLDKVRAMEIKITYPAHRDAISDCRERIDELKQHHEKRLTEVLKILREGFLNGAQVAGRMNWTLNAGGFEDISLSQKYFALGETLAHLNYLKEEGKTLVTDRGGVFYYSLRDDSIDHAGKEEVKVAEALHYRKNVTINEGAKEKNRRDKV